MADVKFERTSAGQQSKHTSAFDEAKMSPVKKRNTVWQLLKTS
jgi:hypothetical protein